MGFAANMISSNRQNRALQRKYKKQFLSGGIHANKYNNHNYNTTERYYSDSNQYQIIIILFSVIIISVVSMHAVHRIINIPISPKKELITPKTAAKQNVYRRYLNRGKRYLCSNQYDLAIKDFSVAIKVSESHEVNYFMAIALLSSCQEHNRHCSTGLEYYNALMSSAELSYRQSEELDILYKYIPMGQ